MNSRCGIVPCGLEPDAAAGTARDRSPSQSLPGREGQRVADDRPQHADEAERDEAHHHRVERVLRADQPAVEERQRRRHQKHQRGRDQHPCSSVHRLYPSWSMRRQCWRSSQTKRRRAPPTLSSVALSSVRPNIAALYECLTPSRRAGYCRTTPFSCPMSEPVSSALSR